MKVFVAVGFLLLVPVIATLGNVQPRLRAPLEEDAHLESLQGDVQCVHGGHHKNIGAYNIGSCQNQYVNCLLNNNNGAGKFNLQICYNL